MTLYICGTYIYVCMYVYMTLQHTATHCNTLNTHVHNLDCVHSYSIACIVSNAYHPLTASHAHCNTHQLQRKHSATHTPCNTHTMQHTQRHHSQSRCRSSPTWTHSRPAKGPSWREYSWDSQIERTPWRGSSRPRIASWDKCRTLGQNATVGCTAGGRLWWKISNISALAAGKFVRIV